MTDIAGLPPPLTPLELRRRARKDPQLAELWEQLLSYARQFPDFAGRQETGLMLRGMVTAPVMVRTPGSGYALRCVCTEQLL